MTHVPPEPVAPPTTPPTAPPTAPPTRGRGCGRWALGCGGAFLILLIVGGVLTWNFVGQPLWSVYTAVQEVQNVGDLDARLTNRAPFAPPADGVLTADQMERYVAVLERTGGATQARLDDLQQRFEDLDDREFAWTDVWRLGDAYAGSLRLLVETKEAQVAALNAEDFSAEEYAWVRGAVLRAAGLPGVGYGVADFAGALTGGAEPDVRPSVEPVPPANRELVERFRERLDEVAFLAALGL
ncbi:MAG: hypothetical protein ABR510_05940 [Trueperaceae bacterium]